MLRTGEDFAGALDKASGKDLGVDLDELLSKPANVSLGGGGAMAHCALDRSHASLGARLGGQ
jgi:hypothetical protein